MSAQEPVFKKEDVWAVATAIGDGLYVDESGRSAYLLCSHCKESRHYSHRMTYDEQAKFFRHESKCAVLIARDLLVGCPL